MFAKRPQPAGGLPAPPSPFPAVLQTLLANPAVSVGVAGAFFLVALIALIAVTGDPRAGSPRVRISLSHGSGGSSVFSNPFAGLGGSRGQAANPSSGADASLPPAPIAGLTAPGPGGLLPIIGSDGRTPAQAYARPFRDTGAPKVALVIGGLGLNKKITLEAIEQLPPEVTLSFVPYADELQGWIDQARIHGHEVLLEAPMEPVDYPQNDPGAFTLMAQDPGPETVKRLEWLLSRASGYFGVINYLGGRFLASDSAVAVLTGALRQRGLAFVDDGSAAGKSGGGVPRASAERIIDANLDGASIDHELSGLEDSARQHGRALGSGFAYPVTLQQVRQWAAGLNGRGLVLAPASAMTAGRGS